MATAFVTFDGSREQQTGAVTSFPTGAAIAVGATSRPAIIVLICFPSPTATITGVTWGGTGTAVHIGTVHRNDGASIDIWVIPAPSGTGLVTVNVSAAVDLDFIACLCSDADQTTPVTAGDIVYADGAAVSNLTAHANNLTANDLTLGMGVLTVAGGVGVATNEIWRSDATAINFAAGSNTGTSDVNVTYTGTTSSSRLTFAAVRVAQNAAAAGPPINVSIGEPVVAASTF